MMAGDYLITYTSTVTYIHKHDCDACNAGGGHRLPFPKRILQKFTYFAERISSDMCGPFPMSVDGYQYALCFVDSFTNHLHVFLLKTKSSDEVKACFHTYLTIYKDHLPKDKPIRWHTDNGGEFT